MQEAIFAAGCFWGVQYYFDQIPGVIETEVGYTGGNKENPTWEEVYKQKTGHAEAVRVSFDPEIVQYETLVKHFFRLHDPTQLNRQGPDVGASYRSAIFYRDDTQRKTAEKVANSIQAQHDEPIVTEISPAKTFHVAEDFHQKFTERTGRGMCHVPYKKV